VSRLSCFGKTCSNYWVCMG